MQVRVDQARQHQIGAVVRDLDAGAGAAGDFGMLADIGNLAAPHQHGAVLEVAIGGGIVDVLGLVDKGQNAAADQQIGH
ncbi:hypothetical protein D9M72_504540 [compost metagenome]